MRIVEENSTIMANAQEKTLEVKVRPYPNQSQERPDQDGASRVLLSMNTLLDLGLTSGQTCYVWKLGDVEGRGGERKEMREAVAWLSTEKNLSKKVAQVSKAFQEACGFKLSDELGIASGGGVQPRVMKSVVFKDVSVDGEALQVLDEEDRVHWEWHLKRHLSRAKIVFTGMTFKLAVDGPKRTFVVSLIDGMANGLGQYSGCEVKISNQAHEDVQLSAASSSLPPLQVANIAGIDQALEKLNGFLSEFTMEFAFPWAHRSGAVLLHGGHGSGKTFLLNKIAATNWGKVYRIKRKDAKPAAIEKLFNEARLSQPSVIILDDLQNIVSGESPSSQSVLETLEEEMDNLYGRESSTSLPKVLIVAATLETSNIPMSLKGLSGFSTEISLSIPDAPARKAILKFLDPPITPEIRDEVLEKLGDRTHAYTAKDLVMLLSTAGKLAEKDIDRTSEDWKIKEHFLSQDNIEEALLLVRPTAMHDITLKPPSVRWDDIGGQESVKKALRRAIETPLKYPILMKRIGISPTKGLLLYGPPGCSKTLSAQAMATEAGFNFFAVKGAELLNMYVGESERAVRDIFSRARAASPSIIFFDEIDSIGSRREGGRAGGGGVNVLTTLLNEMDGIETLKGVTVLAATNKPQQLDLALLRPGRFDELLYVAPPDFSGREAIFRVRKKRMDFGDDVDIAKLAMLTEGYSGAELVSICEKAGQEVVEACKESGDQELKIEMRHFENAIRGMKKQITVEMVESFLKWAGGVGGDTD